MNKQMREILSQIDEIENKIDSVKAEGKELFNSNKLEEAKAKTEEAKELRNKQKELKNQYELAKELFEDEKENAMNKQTGNNKVEAQYNADLFAKLVRGEKLTDIENALVTTGDNGENLLIPKDVSTKIYELTRQYKSARSIAGYYPTTTLEGSYPIETIDTLTELINFTDSEDVPESNEPKFVNVEYKVKEYGGILPLSNTLLKNETAGLVNYLARWFAKKAIRTENKLIFAKLKEGKNPKTIVNLDDLAKIINVDLDPASVINGIIVTNQDGFDYMDSQKDANGRGLLEQDPTNSTRKMFKGLPIEVYSNAELKTVGNKAPIFVGDTTEGVDLVDRESLEFAMSSEAGFKQNKTYIRVIESIDVTAKDKGAYEYAQIDITEA